MRSNFLKMDMDIKTKLSGLQEELSSAVAKDQNLPNSERLISVLAGGLILLDGVGRIFKKPKSGFMRIAAGSALLLRGASGYCPLKKMMDSDQSKEKITIIESHR